MLADFDRCYRAVQSRDARFDGWFFTAVTSTRIYCRPSCPARTPQARHVRFYPTAAAAQQAGFRACLRCRPDAAPGSPEWLGRADVAARAIKLILNGTVDREGVAGLARRLGYSPRQLHRVLMAEVGTGAVALARAQRAQTARLLLETTDLPVSQVAFAAGFASVRQFNDTVRLIFARTPTELRRHAGRTKGWPGSAPGSAEPGGATISLRLPARLPFAEEPLFTFLGLRAVPGVEEFDGRRYRRSLRLDHGEATVELQPLEPGTGAVGARFVLEDLRDLTTAVARCRHLLNLDADPVAVDGVLGADPLLGRLVRGTPGLRVPGCADGFELAVRAVIGQQVSVTGARTVAARLVQAAGTPLRHPRGGVTHIFPGPDALCELAAARPGHFPMPTARRLALGALAGAVRSGEVCIDAGADPLALHRVLVAIPGIGPWTSSYVAMRAIGDPDAFMPTDLGLRRATAQLGAADDAKGLLLLAERWRPWRAYAMAHLWSVAATAGGPRSTAGGTRNSAGSTRSTRSTRSTARNTARNTRSTRTRGEPSA